MNILIIEDEILSARFLSSVILRTIEDSKIMSITESVEESVAYIREHSKEIDLIFSDIQLADGLCFSIFETVNVEAPIIFTTAYDNYALRAFEYNSLSYIIKPVNDDDVIKAVRKALRFSGIKIGIPSVKDMEEMAHSDKCFLRKLLLDHGDEVIPADVSDICAVVSDYRSVMVFLEDGRWGRDNRNLHFFESALDPTMFTKVSRKAVINPSKVKSYRIQEDGNYSVEFVNPLREPIIINKTAFNKLKGEL